MCQPGSVIYLRAFSETNVRKENYPRDKCLPALRQEETRQAFGAVGWAVWDPQEQEMPILVSGCRIVRAFCWFGELYYV
ncbi:hypothetical protein [uncultured Paludibaculum sp.]|uniref:hypothetical protein n=1 Tax=uncultured Paludibaculum sp. TaxID=1765020 RepID=UPI002AAA6457|nr:hypothetical protein [uncultured Paludibaculum sp.]